jgi:hypothetical protein
VLERAPNLRIESESRPVRRFVAHVRLAATRARGTLLIVEPDGRKARREVEAEDCAQVVQALALIVVVLADVKLEEAAPGELSSPAEPERDVPTRKASATRLRLQLESGALLQATTAVAPDVALGPGAFVGLLLTQGARPPLAALRIGVSRAQSGTIQGTLGDAGITWTAARTAVCGPGWPNPHAYLTACAFFDLGEIRGSGSRAAATAERKAVWAAPGLALRADVRLASVLSLQAEIGAFLPLIRPRFFFGARPGETQDETIHRVPGFGAASTIGTVVHFP